jgi:hypothetical protein
MACSNHACHTPYAAEPVVRNKAGAEDEDELFIEVGVCPAGLAAG